MPTTPAADAAAVQDTAATRLWPVWSAAVQQARMNPQAEIPSTVATSLEIAAYSAVIAAWAALRRRPGKSAGEVPARLDDYDFRIKAQQITDDMMKSVWKTAIAHVKAQPPETDKDFAKKASYSSSAEIMSRAQIAFGKELGLKYKLWISRGDEKVRELHRQLHGGISELDKPFKTWASGQSLSYPGDPKAPLDAIINCRCLLALVPTKSGAVEAMRPSNLTDAFTIAASLELEWA